MKAKIWLGLMGWVLGLVCSGVGWAEQVKVTADVANPVMTADKKDTTYLKVGLTGFELAKEGKRTPVNIAIVLDHSGSMSGSKIARAKEAAAMAVDRLNSNDIVSLVVYDDTVDVLYPASKLTDKRGLEAAIEKIQPGESTALFAGVSKGAEEVKKFLEKERVNRVILLSDGLANVGPSSPSELGDFGASLIKDGISVTTIGLGLGFNEDLMTQLAGKSDGNHAFVENENDLKRIFNAEFGDVLSVVAQEVLVSIRCAEGIRPVRILGREGDISGQTARVTLNQLYAAQEKFILLEVEVPAVGSGQTRELASVEVSYLNMGTQVQDRITSSCSVRFSEVASEIEKALNKDVMVQAVRHTAAERTEDAVRLRDAGNLAEARRLLLDNAAMLKQKAQSLASPVLDKDSLSNQQSADNLDESKWNKQRKTMESDSWSLINQQSYQ
jgi:Ca-activated chloride channel homolog